MKLIEDSIACLLRAIQLSDGQSRTVVVGAGFLVGEDRRNILTCAHVLRGHLTADEAFPGLIGKSVTVGFPLLKTKNSTREARIDFVDTEQDIAGLTLLADAPPGSAPAKLIVSDDELERHRFKAFGLPKAGKDGEWAYGEICGANGPWIQIQAESDVGRRIRRGYSGTAVYDLDLHGVAGMVVVADEQGTDRVAFMIPAKTLVAAWSSVLKGQAIPRNPYKGINPFEQSDSDFFFGRRALVDALAEQIRTSSFVPVVAHSGSGKSSVIRAGLASVVRQWGWQVLIVRGIGKDPFKSLAAELAAHAPEASGAYSEVVGRLASAMKKNGLCDEVGHRADLQEGGRLLLVLDQFEELFTRCHDETLVASFAEQLADLARLERREDARVVVLCAGRSDYLPDMQRLPGLGEFFSTSSVDLPHMSADELRAAIEEPAAKLGVAFEKDVVDRMVADVIAQPSGLPHLQYVLTLLWEEQKDHVISAAAYDRLGGVHDALRRQAEAAYGRLSEDEQAAARRIFVQLVHLRKETKGTRRPIREEDLLPGDWRVLESLADSLLITTLYSSDGGRGAELAHEALVDAWPRLQDWVDSTAENVWRLDREAEQLIHQHIAGTVAVAAVPYADIALVPAVVARMAHKMGGIYGVDIDEEAAKTISTSVIAGLVAVGTTWLTAINLFKNTVVSIPGVGFAIGWAVEAPLLVPMTWAIGRAWQFYFRLRYIGGGAPSPEQMRELALAEFRKSLAKLRRKADDSKGPTKVSVAASAIETAVAKGRVALRRNSSRTSQAWSSWRNRTSAKPEKSTPEESTPEESTPEKSMRKKHGAGKQNAVVRA